MTIVKDIKWLSNQALVEFSDGSVVSHSCNFDRYSRVKTATDPTLAYKQCLAKTSKPKLVRTAYGF